MGLSAPFFNSVFMALIQTKVEPKYLGRVLGLTGAIMTLASPLGWDSPPCSPMPPAFPSGSCWPGQSLCLRRADAPAPVGAHLRPSLIALTRKTWYNAYTFYTTF